MSPQDQQQQPGFFDKNTLIAIVLSFAVFFFWQQYMNKKYPKMESETAPISSETSVTQSKSDNNVSSGTTPGDLKSGDVAKLEINSNIEVQKLTFDSEDMSFDLSSKSMALENIKLKKFTRRSGENIQYELPVNALKINGASLFKISKVSDFQFEGVNEDSGSTKKVVITVDPKKYLVDYSIQINQSEKSKTSIMVTSQAQVIETEKSFFLPPTEHQEFFINATDKITRDKIDPKSDYNKQFANGQIAALNSQYFALANINKSEVYPAVLASSKAGIAQVTLAYESAQPMSEQVTSFQLYAGPKQEQSLQAVDFSLTTMIDYGIFGFIGRPMHAALVATHRFVGNWGLAIILVTLLLRTLILPVGVYSFRSMKKMQKIQPKLQAIKEKYKNDPQRINQETLQLMRVEKANPLSGCIPALMQIPIFVAFFSMMSSSFELYKQPFFFWIHDLSAKDPFFVFPILAGAGMFIQQKLTPMTTTDPAQAKIMAFMPLLFSVFMLSTPSGLALYMFIGSLFSIFQQLIFMKEKTT